MRAPSCITAPAACRTEMQRFDRCENNLYSTVLAIKVLLAAAREKKSHTFAASPLYHHGLSHPKGRNQHRLLRELGRRVRKLPQMPTTVAEETS